MTVRPPALNFRLKLFLAMMLVVTGVAGAALLVTQRAVAATYSEIFEERFRAEVDLFSAAQEARLAAVRDKCLELAGSVRLIAAMDENDVALLYKIAFDELREVLNPELPRRALRRASFFRFVANDGRVLPPPDGRAGLTESASRAEWEPMLAAAAHSIPGSDRQAFGYLPLRPDQGRTELEEVIFTRVRDPVAQRTLGAIAIGFPLPAAGAGPRSLASGLWVGGAIYSGAIPPGVGAAIGRQIRVAGGRPPDSGRSVADLDGLPHRVMFRALPGPAGFPPAYQVCLYSMAELLETERGLRRTILGFGGLALAVALALSLRISRGLSGPIQELVAATAEIQRGNFAVQVAVRARDEVGRLAGSFNAMAAGLALKEKYRSVLDLVTDRQVAAELMNGSFALGGEVRDVSVLFCDIRGFTAFTEKMDPAEVVTFLNEHMTALTAVVYEHRGVVDKFVGDLVMAVFGAPKSYGNDAYDAVRCAQRMIEARGRLNTSSRYQVSIGIGIASGAVVAGCTGSKQRLNYTVLGERVNLASRLCGHAGAMEILVDETTRERLSSSIVAETLPELTLKGFSRSVAAFRVADFRSSPT